MWCRPHPFGQPLILICRSVAAATWPAPQEAPEQISESARLRHGKLARLRARAARDVGDGPCVGQREARRCESAEQRFDILVANPAEEQILLLRHAHEPVAVDAREVAEDSHLLPGEVSERDCDRHRRVTLLLLRPNIRSLPALEVGRGRTKFGPYCWRDAGALDRRARGSHGDVCGGRSRSALPGGGVFDGRIVGTEGELRAALDTNTLPLPFVLLAVALPAERLDEKLHPVLVLALAIAEAMEDADDGLSDVKDLASGRELVEQVARPTHRCCAAADGNPEPQLRSAVRSAQAGLETDVVNRGARVVLRATLEGDLELARERRRQRVPQEIPGQRIGERGDVKELVLGYTSVRAAGDVAHRVPAGFARGDPDVGEELHRQLHVVQLHEMELDVLARGDVAKATRVALGDRREGVWAAGIRTASERRRRASLTRPGRFSG